MDPTRHILVAVDFHAASLRALGYAVRLARSVGAELTLLYVFDPSAQIYPADLPPPVPPPELRRAAERDLSELRASLREGGMEVRAILRDGTAAHEILAAASDLEADLLVMGTHGRHGLSRLVLGSVAEQVVRRSPVPVVTLHEWHFTSRAEAARRLVRRVEPLRGDVDVTIAITRGAVPLAIDVARALGTPVDVLLTEPVDGGRDLPIGAACEDGTVIIDEERVAMQRLDGATVTRATDAARAIAGERARWLADPEGARPLTGKRVLLVCDRIVTPFLARAASRAAARRGARHVTLAAPLCASSVLAALPPDVDATVCIETTQLESPAARVFLDEGEPSNLEAAELLVRAGHRRAAAQPTVT